ALSRPLGHQQFACVACRSTEQAETKAKEYRESGGYRNAVVLKSFWDHYKASCDAEGLPEIQQHEFPNHSDNGILSYIKSKQPSVLERLEHGRRGLWIGPEGRNVFDSAMTVLFTSHALAKMWYRSRLTRLWHHPTFVPLAEQDHASLRA